MNHLESSSANSHCPLFLSPVACLFQDIIDSRDRGTLSFDQISDYLEDTPVPLLRNNETYLSYHEHDRACWLARSNWLSDKNASFINAHDNKTYIGEVDRWWYASQLTYRAMVDAGPHGGTCDVTFTVRNSETQRNIWEGIELNEHARNLLAPNPDTAGAPPIGPSHERWTQLANEGIGLFPLLREDFQDTPEHQAFGLKCGKSYFLLE